MPQQEQALSSRLASSVATEAGGEGGFKLIAARRTNGACSFTAPNFVTLSAISLAQVFTFLKAATDRNSIAQITIMMISVGRILRLPREPLISAAALSLEFSVLSLDFLASGAMTRSSSIVRSMAVILLRTPCGSVNSRTPDRESVIKVSWVPIFTFPSLSAISSTNLGGHNMLTLALRNSSRWVRLD